MSQENEIVPQTGPGDRFTLQVGGDLVAEGLCASFNLGMPVVNWKAIPKDFPKDYKNSRVGNHPIKTETVSVEIRAAEPYYTILVFSPGNIPPIPARVEPSIWVGQETFTTVSWRAYRAAVGLSRAERYAIRKARMRMFNRR